MDYTIEKNLIQGLRDRDDAAFEYLRSTCYGSVAFVARSNGGSEEDEYDLYSEGILILLTKIDNLNLKMTCLVQSMFIQICRNRANVALKKKQASQNYLNQKQDDSYEESFEEELDRKVYKAIYWKSLKKLKEDCQKLMLKVFDNKPLKVIAEEMDLSPGYVKNKKKICLKAFKGFVNTHPDYVQMVKNNEIRPE